MEETSNLSKIENAPDHPMAFFQNILTEVENYRKDLIKVMCVASINDEKQILNRNVILVHHDDKGFIFVTERNSRKYKDFMKNPSVAATFLWTYHSNECFIYRQVRINGKITELSDNEIAEFYKNEPLFAKIRCKICKCGTTVNWDELKKSHDNVLQAYRNGTEPLTQNENYTALRVNPEQIDFYYAKECEIADRILYTKNADGKWTNEHIAA